MIDVKTLGSTTNCCIVDSAGLKLRQHELVSLKQLTCDCEHQGFWCPKSCLSASKVFRTTASQSLHVRSQEHSCRILPTAQRTPAPTPVRGTLQTGPGPSKIVELWKGWLIMRKPTPNSTRFFSKQGYLIISVFDEMAY